MSLAFTYKGSFPMTSSPVASALAFCHCKMLHHL
jgi:hypothetical protein